MSNICSGIGQQCKLIVLVDDIKSTWSRLHLNNYLTVHRRRFLAWSVPIWKQVVDENFDGEWTWCATLRNMQFSLLINWKENRRKRYITSIYTDLLPFVNPHTIIQPLFSHDFNARSQNIYTQFTYFSRVKSQAPQFGVLGLDRICLEENRTQAIVQLTWEFQFTA